MINKVYLEKSSYEQIRSTLASTTAFPSVILHDFFLPEAYEKYQALVKKLYYHPKQQLLSHSYSLASVPPGLCRALQSSEMLDFLSLVLGIKVKLLLPVAYKLEWKNYTVLHDATPEEPGTDFILDFTENWDPQSGGAITYKDGEGNFIRIPIRKNTLTLVRRDVGMQRFIQYVNHRAENTKRYFVLEKIQV